MTFYYFIIYRIISIEIAIGFSFIFYFYSLLRAHKFLPPRPVAYVYVLQIGQVLEVVVRDSLLVSTYPLEGGWQTSPLQYTQIGVITEAYSLKLMGGGMEIGDE